MSINLECGRTFVNSTIRQIMHQKVLFLLVWEWVLKHVLPFFGEHTSYAIS